MKARTRRVARFPVWIVDDNRSYCLVLSESLKETRTVECTGCYYSCKAAINALNKSDSLPAVILLDIKMPKMSGLDAIWKIHQISPATHIIMLTSYDTDENIQTSLKQGASGYLLKTSTPSEIAAAIVKTRTGAKALDKVILDRMIESYYGQMKKSQYHITERERDVLELIAKGLTTRQVALQLSLSYYTVDMHIRNIFQKFNVHTRHGLVAKAGKEHLL